MKTCRALVGGAVLTVVLVLVAVAMWTWLGNSPSSKHVRTSLQRVPPPDGYTMANPTTSGDSPGRCNISPSCQSQTSTVDLIPTDRRVDICALVRHPERAWPAANLTPAAYPGGAVSEPGRRCTLTWSYQGRDVELSGYRPGVDQAKGSAERSRGFVRIIVGE